MPHAKRPRILRGRNMTLSWEPAGDPYDMNFTALKLTRRSGTKTDNAHDCAWIHAYVIGMWNTRESITPDAYTHARVTHASNTGPSGNDYSVDTPEGYQYFSWPEWMGDDAYEWVTAVTFSYFYDGNYLHNPLKLFFSLWGYSYDILDAQIVLNLKFPESKTNGAMCWDMSGWPWPSFCPTPQGGTHIMEYERKVTFYWNFWFRKNCFKLPTTSDETFWFWVSRAEGNPPILCPPFYAKR